MPNIKHAFTSAKSDGGDATLIQPSNWNAEHVVDQYLDLPDVSTPAAPSTGNLRLFTRTQAGRQLLAMVGPAGIDTNIQPALFRNTIYLWLPGTGTTTSINFGTNYTARNSGTGAAQAHPTKNSTNAITSMNRATFGTGTTATGQSGIQSGATVAWRGNAANLGGFFYFARFGVETHEASMQYLVGLSALNAAISADPSTINNSCGICKDAADTNWHIFTKSGTTTTKTDTGLAVAAGTILDFFMFAPPNGSDIKFRLVNAVNGTVYVDDASISTNLPVNTTFMHAHVQARSTVGTTAKLLALNRLYVESDL